MFFFLEEMHTLHQYCIASSGIEGLPAYIQVETVDDKVLSHYDSTTQEKLSAQCMKSHLDPTFWNKSILYAKQRQELLIGHLKEKQKNQTGECIFLYSYTCIYTSGGGCVRGRGPG